MRLNCNINGSQYSLVVSSDKPLSQILREHIITFAENSQCLGASCGNCMVLINGNAALSCLVPAFKINGASILTFERQSSLSLFSTKSIKRTRTASADSESVPAVTERFPSITTPPQTSRPHAAEAEREQSAQNSLPGRCP